MSLIEASSTPEGVTTDADAARPVPAAPGRPRRSSVAGGVALAVVSGLLAVWSLEDFHVERADLGRLVPAIVAHTVCCRGRWSGLGLGICRRDPVPGIPRPRSRRCRPGVVPVRLQASGSGAARQLAGGPQPVVPHSVRGTGGSPSAHRSVWVALDFARTGDDGGRRGQLGDGGVRVVRPPRACSNRSPITGIHGLNLLILVVNWTVALVVLAVARPALRAHRRTGRPCGHAWPGTRRSAPRWASWSG